VAETELTRLNNRLKDAERLVLLEVKTGFYDLLLSESRFDLAQKSLELNNQLLLITKERLAAGDVAELDVNLAKVEVARSDARKIEAERELGPTRQRLLALMGTTSLTTLNIAGSPAARPLLPNAAELRKLALQHRPDLQAILAEKAKGEAELSLAHAERIPNLTAGISLNYERTKTAIGGMEERNTDYLIGLKLSLPIPVFDKNQAGVQEAQARKNSVESRHLYLTQNIEREVDAAQARVASAEKALTIYSKEILPQLTENLKLVQEAYRLGEVGIQAVIEEQKKFIEVNDAQLAALHSWNGAVARLEAAVGTELKKEDGGNN
jgi:cobalt-zinc-cadmium efflux system outer membrane protein